MMHAMRRTTKVTGKSRVQRRLDLAIQEGMACHEEDEDEGDQMLDVVVHATAEIGDDPMITTEMSAARTPIGVTMAIHRGTAVGVVLLAELPTTNGLTTRPPRKRRRSQSRSRKAPGPKANPQS